MTPVIVWMDGRYTGDVIQADADRRNGVSAFLSKKDNHVVAYQFSGMGWNQRAARQWIKNSKRNQIVWREHGDGNVMINTVLLNAQISGAFEGETVKEVLGREKYDNIMVIESENNSSKPFIVEVVAMDFKGKDSVIGNGLEFDRKTEIDHIDDFVNLKIHKGHLGFFQDYQDSIGNTVASKVGEDGNPRTFVYIYPHGDAGNFRTNLRLAAAQGPEMLKKYPVSMRGTILEMDVVQDDDDYKPDVALGEDKAYARVKAWKRVALDFVDEGALDGSEPKRILNSKDIGSRQLKLITRKGAKVDTITLSEIQDALKSRDSIALSDLSSIPCVRKALDEYISVKLSENEKALLKKEDHVKEVISSCSDDILLSSDRVKSAIETALTEKSEAVQALKNKVPELAKGMEVELSKGQQLHVMEGIVGDESEDDIKEKIKAAVALSGLGDNDQFHLSRDDSFVDGDGASMREASPEEIKNAQRI